MFLRKLETWFASHQVTCLTQQRSKVILLQLLIEWATLWTKVFSTKPVRWQLKRNLPSAHITHPSRSQTWGQLNPVFARRFSLSMTLKNFCKDFIYLFLLKKILVYFIDYAITVVQIFLPFIPLLPCTPRPSSIPPLSSCPWVIHISSLASLFPVPFLISPCLFYAYQYASYSLHLSLDSSPPPPHW